MLLGTTGKAAFQKEKTNETGFSSYFKSHTTQEPSPFQCVGSLAGCDTAASCCPHPQLQGTTGMKHEASVAVT